MEGEVVVIEVPHGLGNEVDEDPLGNVAVSHCVLEVLPNHLVLRLHQFQQLQNHREQLLALLLGESATFPEVE